MKSKLKTKNVFVDTSAFIHENFAVRSTAFKSLMSLCRMDKASLKLTDVTLQEIEANIERGLAEANKALETKTRNTRILRNFDKCGYEVLFRPLDQSNLKADLMKLLHSDFASAQAEIVSVMKVSPLAVFDKYFQKKPPFGLSKKKEEFPDAFVLTALEDWCARNKQILYVVSTDGDMKSACNENGPLLHLNSIAEFVDLVLRDEDDEAEFLAQFFVDNPKPIIEKIRTEFEDRPIYLEDEDGEGEASVSNIDLGAAAVVMMSEGEATLELDVTVSFYAHVTYSDPSSTSYDSEDHMAYVWSYKQDDLDRTETIPAEVSIKYEPGSRLNYQVTSVRLNNGDPVRVYVDEDARTNWK